MAIFVFAAIVIYFIWMLMVDHRLSKIQRSNHEIEKKLEELSGIIIIWHAEWGQRQKTS
ncbi:MAG TPA: hypothetical protein VM658_20620 [bacterium]|nr:hypothetical protein [bacterium]